MSTRDAAIDRLVAAAGRKHDTLAVGTFADGESTFRGSKMTEPLFEIGSVTKVFTRVLLADMTLAGKVSLDDPITTYLPSDGEVRLTDPVSSLLPATVKISSRNGRAITLEHLATHSSGLPREATNLRPKRQDNPFAGYDAAQLYVFLNRYKLPRDPGAAIEYSKVGVGLLGHALALRAGKSFGASGMLLFELVTGLLLASMFGRREGSR
jgi:serine-type D-Ala-D-Ala carboxypeptidase/endopeptidase